MSGVVGAGVGEQASLEIAVLTRPEASLERLDEERVQLDPVRFARLRPPGAQPDAAALLVVVADEGEVDRADAGTEVSTRRQLV